MDILSQFLMVLVDKKVIGLRKLMEIRILELFSGNFLGF